MSLRGFQPLVPFQMPVPDLVRITDVSPRDGLQNESGVIATTDKARLIELLCATGVDEVEVTSFVSKKWVPQLGDATELCGLLRKPLPEGGVGVGEFLSATPRARSVTLSALVPNAQGLAAALALKPQVLHKLSVFTAASETFAQKNTNATIAQTLERFVPVIAGATQHHFSLRGYISCVIACPFEGPIAPAAVRRVADQLWALGVDEIDLGDTIGAADETSTRALLREFRDWPQGRSGQPGVTLHLHDTFGTAAACVRVALELGLRSFDGSVAGLGGCPYASTPAKRAPGNISTELLVRTIHEAGLRTHVDLAALETAATFARDIVAKSRAASSGATA